MKEKMGTIHNMHEKMKNICKIFDRETKSEETSQKKQV
jgi:hypothetical protein